MDEFFCIQRFKVKRLIQTAIIRNKDEESKKRLKFLVSGFKFKMNNFCENCNLN